MLSVVREENAESLGKGSDVSLDFKHVPWKTWTSFTLSHLLNLEREQHRNCFLPLFFFFCYFYHRINVSNASIKILNKKRENSKQCTEYYSLNLSV